MTDHRFSARPKRRAAKVLREDSIGGDSQVDSASTEQFDAHLVDTLATSIQERISSGELPVGTWLRQERLAQDLGVSRMPVREALRQLHAKGIVEIITNRGARVRLPSLRDITEMYELRGLLEGHAGAAAAQLITAKQLQRLQQADAIFRRIAAKANGKQGHTRTDLRSQWFEANSQFHAVIVEASGNKHLAEVIDRLHSKIPRNLTWLALGDDSRRLMRNAVEHSQIFEAIENGDSKRARALLITHAKHASDLLVRRLA